MEIRLLLTEKKKPGQKNNVKTNDTTEVKVPKNEEENQRVVKLFLSSRRKKISIQPILFYISNAFEDLIKNKNYYDSYNEEYSNYDINDLLKEEIKLKTIKYNQISNLNNINENVIQKKLNY